MTPTRGHSLRTDDTAPETDSAQYETGIGPCLDAFRQQSVFVVAGATATGAAASRLTEGPDASVE